MIYDFGRDIICRSRASAMIYRAVTIAVFSVLLLVGFCSFQNAVSHLRGRLLDRKTGKRIGNTLIVVKRGRTQIGFARTSNGGKFAIDLTVRNLDSADKVSWLYFYAVRKPLDTVLLEKFYSYPARFAADGYDGLKADLYMP